MKIFGISLLFVILTTHFQVKVFSQSTITDTSVINLMNTFRFREAANTINEKLEKTNPTDFDRLLYYNNQLSMAYIRLMLIDSAMFCARNSLHLSAISVDSVLVSDAWKVASYSYNRNGVLDSAIFYTQLMLNYAERNGNKRLVRNSMSSLGTILNQNERFGEALYYHKKAYRLTEDMEDSVSLSIMFFNLGLTYNELDQLDSSLFYLEKSLYRSLKEKHYESALDAYVMIANTYLQLNDFTRWKENTLKLQNLAEKINNQKYVAHANSHLMYGLIKSKKYREALLYGNKAVEILKSYPFPSLQLAVDSGMYVAYEAIGDYAGALNYLKLYYEEKYSLLNEKQKEQLNEMQVKFEVKEKDLTIAKQELDLTRKQRNFQLLLFMAVILILIIIAIVIYNIRTNRFRKKLYKKEKYLDNQIIETKQWMTRVGLKKSQTLANFGILPVEGETSPVEQNILSPQSILYAELREMIENQKLYLNPELNLQMLIKLLGTNKKYLYEAISSNTDNNFRNFINRYRIDYAKRVIEESVRKKTTSNLSELYEICGFNNPTSFFRTFKIITGLTPKEYTAEAEIDYKSGINS